MQAAARADGNVQAAPPADGGRRTPRVHRREERKFLKKKRREERKFEEREEAKIRI